MFRNEWFMVAQVQLQALATWPGTLVGYLTVPGPLPWDNDVK